jgi:hypothetical protein
MVTIFKVGTSEHTSKALWRYNCCISHAVLHNDGVGCNSKQAFAYYKILVLS